MGAAVVYGRAGGDLALGHVVDAPRSGTKEAETEVYNTIVGDASGSTKRDTNKEQQLFIAEV